jgi:V/A-type H+-transporting ATPase subunit I
MIRPEKLSLLKISIHRSKLAQFLNEIPYFPYFQIREYKKEKSPYGYYRRERNIIAEHQDMIKQQIHDIEENLIYMFNQLEIDPEKIIIEAGQEKVKIEAENTESLIDELHQRTENESRRLKGLVKDLQKYQDQFDSDKMLIEILKWLENYKINSNVLNIFNQLQFHVYSTSIKTYSELLLHLDEENIPMVVQSHQYNKNNVGFFLIFNQNHFATIKTMIDTLKIQEIENLIQYLTPTGIHTKDLEQDIIFCQERLERAQNLINDMKNNAIKYRAYLEILDNIRNFLHMEEQFMVDSQNMIIRLEAFIPTRDEEIIVQKLLSKFENKIRIVAKPIERELKEKKHVSEVEDFDLKENESKEQKTSQNTTQIENVPSLIIPNKIFKPFKMLVNMYGTTNYSELDPTPIVAFTYPFLFGMMFGDLGHGLVLLLVGLFIALFLRKKKDTSIYDFGFLLIWLGVAAMAFGFVYGEFFGHELDVLEHHLKPLHNITLILRLAILIGVIHIILGWVLKMVNLIMNHRAFLAFADPFLKICILIGGTILIFTYFFDIGAWLKSPYPILLVIIPTFAAILAKPLGKAIFHISYLEESVGELFGESALDMGETMLSILSNVASYSRLLALAMAHMGLMLIITTVADMLKGMEYLIPIVLIGGNLFVIVLEGILSFIHTLRLHFYEFFGKFYTGDGIAYHNTKIKNDFSEIHFFSDAITHSFR